MGRVFGLGGLRRTLTPDDSGEFRVGGADVFVTFCKREDKPEARRKGYSFMSRIEKRINWTSGTPGVLAFESALRMPSGVMSTRERMLARAGLEGLALEDVGCPEVVVAPAGG